MPDEPILAIYTSRQVTKFATIDAEILLTTGSIHAVYLWQAIGIRPIAGHINRRTSLCR